MERGRMGEERHQRRRADAGEAGARAGEIPVSKFVGSEVVVAVRVTNPKGRDAGWSNLKTFEVKPPLADPANFQVAAKPQGRRINLERFQSERIPDFSQDGTAIEAGIARHRDGASLRRHQRGVWQSI